MEQLVSDPRLAVLLTPAPLLFLMGIIAGLTEASRATRVEGRWLPYVSAAWGVVVAFFAVLTVGAQFGSSTVGFIGLFGLGAGLSTTGYVAIFIHHSTGSTAGSTTTPDR